MHTSVHRHTHIRDRHLELESGRSVEHGNGNAAGDIHCIVGTDFGERLGRS